MGCIGCGRGFHDECETDCATCHPQPETLMVPVEPKQRGRPLKDPEDMKDRKSTGRKRAALLYPLDLKAECEWRGQKNCGGGTYPIIGCLDGSQTDRHHGPIKDPARNEIGNVHRICKPCHNHWHELNDLVYSEETYTLTKHEPKPATGIEIAANIVAWKNGDMGRMYKLASSEKKLRIMDD